MTSYIGDRPMPIHGYPSLNNPFISTHSEKMDVQIKNSTEAKNHTLSSIVHFNMDFSSLINQIWGNEDLLSDEGIDILDFPEEIKNEILKEINFFKHNDFGVKDWGTSSSNESLNPLNQILKGKSWKELKNDFKDDPLKFNHLDTFRLEAIKLIKFIVNHKLSSQLGLPCISSWGGVGTRGTNSDVDISISDEIEGISKKLPLTEEDLMLAKILFETLWTKIFGGLSGKQIDTEVYVRHNGSLRTADNINTTQAKIDFNYMELLGVFLTAYKTYQSEDKLELWNEYKDQIAKAMNLQPEVVKEMCEEVEKLINIQLLGCNQHLLKLAALKIGTILPELERIGIDNLNLEETQNLIAEINKKYPALKDEFEINAHFYNFPFLMSLSSKLGELSLETNNLEIKLNVTQQNLTRAEFENKDPNKIANLKKILENIQKNLDDKRNQFVKLSVVRVTCFPEGYYTEGAFKRVVTDEGGQVFDRKSEELLKSYAKLGVLEKKSLIGFSKSLIQDHFSSENENFVLSLNKLLIKDEKDVLSTSLSRIVDASKYADRFLHDQHAILHQSREINLTLLEEKFEKLKSFSLENLPNFDSSQPLAAVRDLVDIMQQINKMPSPETIKNAWNDFNRKVTALQKFYKPLLSPDDLASTFLELKNISAQLEKNDKILLPLILKVQQSKITINDFLQVKRGKIAYENLSQIICDKLSSILTKDQSKSKEIHKNLKDLIPIKPIKPKMSKNDYSFLAKTFLSELEKNLKKHGYNKDPQTLASFKEEIYLLLSTYTDDSHNELNYKAKIYGVSGKDTEELRYNLFTHELKLFLFDHFPIGNVTKEKVYSKIVSALLDLTIKLGVPSKQSEFTEDEFHSQLLQTLQKESLWASNSLFEPLDPKMNLALKGLHANDHSNARKEAVNQSADITLKKYVGKEQKIVEDLKTLHFEVIQYIQSQDLVPKGKPSNLVRNLSSLWNKSFLVSSQ